jgi:membrane protein implicated in regulation of membrane protease activity
MRILSVMILVTGAALVASEMLVPGAGFRLWLGLALVIAWLIARKSHVFTTT